MVDKTRQLMLCNVLQLDESGNPKEAMNIHSEDGNHQAQSKPTKSPVATTTLSSADNFAAHQVMPLPAEGNQDTLTVSLESTSIVPHSDAGISEVFLRKHLLKHSVIIYLNNAHCLEYVLSARLRTWMSLQLVNFNI